jgi:hypothetical protein
MNTGLLWNTYGKDIEWFKFSARSYSKFARGWDNALCLVPEPDRELFVQPCAEAGIELMSRAEWEGKGFNWHSMMQCSADLLLPEAEAIWHIDSDTVFTQPVTPESWMKDGYLICGYKTYEHLNAIAKTETHSGIWKSRVDAALKGNATHSTMISPPYCHYREVYEMTRYWIGVNHPEGFEEYIKGTQNEFPQGFAEFETLGAVAHRYFSKDYVWRDVLRDGHPSDGLVAEGWSHGGLDSVGDRFEGRTAREVFESLGL